MKKQPVAQPAQSRPLLSIQETKMLTADTNKKPRGPHKTYENGIPHSQRQAQISEKYHAEIVDKPKVSAVRRMNPTKVIPASRSFPGLAN